MATETSAFKLIGKFKDEITRPLKKLKRLIKSTTKETKKLAKATKDLNRTAKNLDRMSRSAKKLGRSFKTARGDISSASREVRKLDRRLRGLRNRTVRVRVVTTRTRGRGSARSAGGAAAGSGGGSSMLSAGLAGGAAGAVAGVLANLTKDFLVKVFDMAKSMIVKPVEYSLKYFAGAMQEAIVDETDDITSAGGIFALGKRSGVKWADTFEKGVSLQETLNQNMAKLAAKLPGETEDYVRNMRNVTDTSMSLFTDTRESAKIMRYFREELGQDVKNEKEGFLALTTRIAKFTTISDKFANLSAGATPFTALFEQLFSDTEPDVEKLKKKFRTTLGANTLLANTLSHHEKAIASTTAGSAERMIALVNAMKDAYPAEVIKAQTESVEGVYQGLLSSLKSMDTGLLGLKRTFEIESFGKKGEKEKTSFFKVTTTIFKEFGTVILPIMEFLPKIFDPLKVLVEPFLELRYNALATSSNFREALDKFKDVKDGSGVFKAAIDALARLAKAWGVDIGDFRDRIEKGENKDLLKEVWGMLTSSEMMDRVGRAIGTFIGEILSKFADTVGQLTGVADGGGGASGFMKGFEEAGGKKAIESLLGSLATGLFHLGEFLFLELIKSLPQIVMKIIRFSFKVWLTLVKMLWGGIKKAFSGIINLGKMVWGGIREAFSWITREVSEFWEKHGNPLWQKFKERVKEEFKKVTDKLAEWWEGLQNAFNQVRGFFESLPDKVEGMRSAVENGLNAIKDFFANLGKNLNPFHKKTPTSSENTPKVRNPNAKFISKSAGLVKAYNKEKSMAPSGSTPVMANSSEIIIPARAKGQGSVKGITDGLLNIKNCIYEQTSTLKAQTAITHRKLDFSTEATKTGFSHLSEMLKGLTSVVKSEGERTRADISGLMSKVASMASMGGGLGGVSGSGILGNQTFGNNPMSYFSKLGEKLGLDTTSTTRNEPGDNPDSYHYHGRAIDLSNAKGPTPEMLRAAQYIAETYGANLKELIYTPLGYSIKNGKKVPPYAKENHYDHIHIAWHRGNTKPLLDEMSSMPKGAKIGYANSSEFIANSQQTKMLASALQGSGGGANVTVNINGFNGNSEELAKKVVYHIETAMNRGRQNSIV